MKNPVRDRQSDHDHRHKRKLGLDIAGVLHVRNDDGFDELKHAIATRTPNVDACRDNTGGPRKNDEHRLPYVVQDVYALLATTRWSIITKTKVGNKNTSGADE